MSTYLFITGAILIIIGWFIEKAEKFRWLRILLARDQNITLETLEALKQNEAIQSDSIQGKVLLNIWPILDEKTNVKFIGRTLPYLNLGANINGGIVFL